MSTDLTTQRVAHRFFLERFQTLQVFTKAELMTATSWSESSLTTYWSKQFKGFVEEVSGGYRLKENFRPYLDWKRFRALVTQVKVVSSDYEPTVYDNIIVYEFYMPLAHEAALRSTLDSLFYKDAIVPRLHRIGRSRLQIASLFPPVTGESDDAFFARVLSFFESKFGGYSIYHVDGRFRADKLSTQADAVELLKMGQRYLVDETTAVTRFIFPCKDVAEADKVRFLFKELFITAITQLVSGEDEIWVVESGMSNRVHVWKPGD
jgi:hypothetical protein